MGVTQLRKIAGETRPFRFEGLLGLLPAVLLHVLGHGNADEAWNSAEAEELGVAACGLHSASRAHVDEHLWDASGGAATRG